MPRKLGLRARGAAAMLLAAIGIGGAAAVTAAPTLPDLSAASLASLRAHDNPALSAAIGRVLVQHRNAVAPQNRMAFQS